MSEFKPIELSLGNNGGPVRFETVEEFALWIKTELESWSWLAPLAQQDGEYNSLIADWMEPIRGAKTRLAEGNVDSAVKAVTQTFGQRKPHVPPERLHSSAPLAKFIKSEADRSPSRAAALLAIHFRHTLPNRKLADQLAAAFDFGRFEQGLLGNEAEKQALDQLRTQWNAQLEQRLRQSVDERAEASRLVSEIGNQHRQHQTDFQEALRQHASQMREIERHYHEAMGMRAPVKYWEERETKHATLARLWGTVAGVYFLLTLALVGLITAFADSPTEAIDGVMAKLDAEKVPLDSVDLDALATKEWLHWVIIKIILLLLAVWPTRLLVRTYLSNQHLAEDAGERHVLIETYLALLNEPDVKADPKLKEQMLPKMLDTIFRHTQTGLVKDDALPQPIGVLTAMRE